MKLIILGTLASLAPLQVASSVLPAALLARQAQSCFDETTYTVDESKPVYDTPVKMVGGKFCTGPCSAGQSDSLTLTTSVEVGAGLDLGEILSLDTSVTYSIGKTTTQVVTEECPKADTGKPPYLCGLTESHQMVTISGLQQTRYTSGCPSTLAGKIYKSKPYKFDAPVTISGSNSVSYAACVSKQSKNQDLDYANLAACPDND